MADVDPSSIGSVDPRKLGDDQLVELLRSAVAVEDAHRVGTQDFVRLVSKASKSQLETVMASDLRSPVLDEVFRRMAQFVRPEKAGGRRSVVHWRIGGRGDGGYDEYTTVIESGGCGVTPGLDDEPRVTLTTGPVEFLGLVTGGASGPLLFMTGRLKLKGDVGYAAGLMNIFDIPKA